jgi:hypothetical protein
LGIVCPVRSGLVVAVDVRSALRVRDAAVWIGAGDGRASGDVGNVLRSGVARGGGLFGLNLQWKLAVLVALGQDLDGEIRAVALTQTAADAVRGFDDRVVRQYEAVLGADLDADVAALAPLVDPPDVDEVDDRGSAVRSSFGGVGRSRGRSPETLLLRQAVPAREVYGIERPAAES